MGCSASKLDDKEAVQLCKVRKNFIKQAIEQRSRFAFGHVAYIQSMRRVSLALLHYVDAGDSHELFSDSCNTSPLTLVRRLTPEISNIPLKSFNRTPNGTVKSTVHTLNYLRSGGDQSVAVEEWPEPHATVQVESYYPMEHYGIDGFFALHSSPVNRSSFFSSPYNRTSHQPPSPQASQWDYIWNPFSSMDSYGYLPRSSFDRIVNDEYEDIAGLRLVREAEGIPELEVVDDDDDYNGEIGMFGEVEAKNETPKVGSKHAAIQVGDGSPSSSSSREDQKRQEVKEFKSQGSQNIVASESPNVVDLNVHSQRKMVGSSAVETPGFTVYVNRRPASMVDVMIDIKNQFMNICDCLHEISVMLEAIRPHSSSSSNELAVRMLNPVALLQSMSLRSSSSRFFQASSGSKGDDNESSSDYSEECCISGSHHSTLDRLYVWEKKLYEEVKSGERVRIAYEKKCMQLRSHDINGEEPSLIDKTRAAISDLHTRLKISIHTVQLISKRIEVLRDGELYPQLMELIQGLSRMWKKLADCHRIQKRTIDEAKLLLFSGSAGSASGHTPPKTPRAAADLAAELRNWRRCFANWIEAQRSYVRAIAGWASRCAPSDTGDRKAVSPHSPGSGGDDGNAAAPPVLGVCLRWSRLVEAVIEARAVEGMEFFAAGMASVSVQQREAEAAERAIVEVGPRVLCAGLAVAVGSLAEVAAAYEEGYDSFVRRCRAGCEEGREDVDLEGRSRFIYKM